MSSEYEVEFTRCLPHKRTALYCPECLQEARQEERTRLIEIIDNRMKALCTCDDVRAYLEGLESYEKPSEYVYCHIHEGKEPESSSQIITNTEYNTLENVKKEIQKLSAQEGDDLK